MLIRLVRMKSGIRVVLVFAFLSGLFLTGMLGTSTSMTFVWPGYLMLGLAGVLSIGALFQHVSFSLPKWTTISAFVLAFYVLSRAANSPVAYFAREDAMMVIACFIAYAGLISLCASVKWRKGVAVAFAGLVIINLGFAALQISVDQSIWLVPGYGRTITEAMGGLFNQPDHFAIFLAALVPLWLSMGIQGRESRVFRFFWKSLAVISVLFLAISGSVAGWITLGVGLLCYGALTTQLVWQRLKIPVRRSAVTVLSILAVGMLLVATLGGSAVGGKLGHGFFAGSEGAGMTSLWKTGLKQAMESPFIGTGSRSSQIYGRLFRTEELGPGATEPEFVHNEYIQVLGDYGAVGLLLILALLGSHLISGMQFLRSFQRIKPAKRKLIPRSNHLALAMGAVAGLMGLATAAMFDFVFHLPVIAMLATVLLAILAVPDPMAQVTRKEEPAPLIPGGTLLFGIRAVGFGGGLSLATLGIIFVQSEFHYEMARKDIEQRGNHFQQYRHLQTARDLDPRNPFVQTLSAHAQVGSITTDMPLAERRQALEKADLYFSRAQQLYPQDVFAAIGHVAVLDELGKKQRARERLRESRQWAPQYGNLMLAEAEHYLRNGQIGLAHETYTESLGAAAFRDEVAAREGIRTISEWKLIAQQNGISLDSLNFDGEGDGSRRVLPDAKIEERAVAGQAERP
ncbi:MAG: O-antigen ligase family protein [Verrucomicrobiota bacterium]